MPSRQDKRSDQNVCLFSPPPWLVGWAPLTVTCSCREQSVNGCQCGYIKDVSPHLGQLFPFLSHTHTSTFLFFLSTFTHTHTHNPTFVRYSQSLKHTLFLYRDQPFCYHLLKIISSYQHHHLSSLTFAPACKVSSNVANHASLLQHSSLHHFEVSRAESIISSSISSYSSISNSSISSTRSKSSPGLSQHTTQRYQGQQFPDVSPFTSSLFTFQSQYVKPIFPFLSFSFFPPPLPCFSFLFLLFLLFNYPTEQKSRFSHFASHFFSHFLSLPPHNHPQPTSIYFLSISHFFLFLFSLSSLTFPSFVLSSFNLHASTFFQKLTSPSKAAKTIFQKHQHRRRLKILIIITFVTYSRLFDFQAIIVIIIVDLIVVVVVI